jgi:hypothetical protein
MAVASHRTIFHIVDDRKLKGTNVESAHPCGIDGEF